MSNGYETLVDSFLNLCVEVTQLSDRVDKLEKKRKQPKLQSEQEWWSDLEKSSLYAHIDFMAERDKMARWLLVPKNAHRKLTRTFVIQWLNRVEKPVTISPGSPFAVGPKAMMKVTANQVEGVPPPPEVVATLKRLGVM